MIRILYIQHRCITRNFTFNRPNGINEYVLILAHTPAYFHANKTKYLLMPNQLFIYDKGYPQLFYNAESGFDHDWFHFDMDESDRSFFLSLNIPFNRPIDLSNAIVPSDIIRLMATEHAACASYSHDILHSLAMCFFMKVADIISSPVTNKTNHPLFAPLNGLRQEVYNFPYRDWTLEELAEAVHISKSWFQHKYREFFETSFKDDLINSRVEYSKSLLYQSDHTIETIAEMCGYNSSVHFMRQFKKITGFTPSGYRKKSLTMPINPRSQTVDNKVK